MIFGLVHKDICGGCSEKAAKMCRICGKRCENCIRVHEKLAEDTHEVVDLTELPQMQTCNIHPDMELEYNCFSCKQLICAKCLILFHSEHQYVNFELMKTFVRNALQDEFGFHQQDDLIQQNDNDFEDECILHFAKMVLESKNKTHFLCIGHRLLEIIRSVQYRCKQKRSLPTTEDVKKSPETDRNDEYLEPVLQKEGIAFSYKLSHSAKEKGRFMADLAAILLIF